MADVRPEPQQFFGQLYPDPQFRRACLEAFADALEFAMSFGSEKWCIRIVTAKEKLRLYVGHVIAMTLSPRGLWLAVDRQKAESSAAESFFETCPAWQWDTGPKGIGGSYPEYRSIRSRNGYYSPIASHREDWLQIRECHFESLRKAATRRIKKKWQRTWIEDYVCREIGTNPFRQPITSTGSQSKDGEALDFPSVAKQPITPVLSHEALRQRNELADHVGRAGERLVCEHLQRQKEAALIQDFEWTSRSNAIAPYDFLITLAGGEKIAVDVKSTNGPLEQKFYVSFAELREMIGPKRYDIYRIFQLSETSGMLSVAENVNYFAAATLKVICQLPEGVRSEALSVDGSVLKFGPNITLAVKSSQAIENF